MKINRYSKVAPAQYNPMSLEELMAVPMLKRKQHDNLLNNISATSSSLAQTDYMDMHEEKVLGVRKKMEDELQRQIEEVSANGISDSLKTDFINLNSEYQNLMGPKGTLGKAALAKQAVAQNKQELLANAVKMGHDPQASATQFEQALALYSKDQREADDISNMGPVYAPNYENLDNDLVKAKQLIGTTITTQRGEEGYSIGVDPTTKQFYVKTESGNVITEDDGGNIGYQLESLKTKWLKEGGAGYKSDNWNLISHEDRMNELLNKANSMRTVKVKDNREENIEFIGGGIENSDPEEENNQTLYEDTQELANTTFSSQSVSETRKQVKDLRAAVNNGSLKGAEAKEALSKARQLDYHLTKLNDELEANPNYKRLKEEKKVFLDKINKVSPEVGELILQGVDPTMTNVVPSKSVDGKLDVLGMNGEIIATIDKNPETLALLGNQTQYNKLYNFNEEISEIEDKIAKNHTIEYVGYVVDKRNETNSKWKAHSNQIVDLISSSGKVGNKYKIDSYVKGTEKFTPRDNETQEELFRLLSDSSNPSITRMYMSGANGEPMVEFSFNANADDEINDGKKWDTVVKEGEKITVRVGLGDFTGDKADPIQRLFISSLGDYGGKKGAYLAEAMENSSKFRHIAASGDPNDFSQSNDIKQAAPFFNKAGMVNLHRDPKNGKFQYMVNNFVDEKSFNNFKQGNLQWNHVITKPMLEDAETLKQLPPKLVDAFTSDFLRYNEAGINLNNISKMSDQELDGALTKFLEFYGEQPIMFNSKEEALLAFK